MPLNPYDHNAHYTDLTQAFLAESRRNLLAAHARIEHCLAQLSDDQLWHRPRPEMNSLANLLLHLTGNVGQWIISAIDNTPSTRNRPCTRQRGSRKRRGNRLPPRGLVRPCSSTRTARWCRTCRTTSHRTVSC